MVKVKNKNTITTSLTGFLLKFKNFTFFSCKISLIKCLIDKSIKSCNICNFFYNDTKNIKSNLAILINKIIKNTSIISFLGTKII